VKSDFVSASCPHNQPPFQTANSISAERTFPGIFRPDGTPTSQKPQREPGSKDPNDVEQVHPMLLPSRVGAEHEGVAEPHDAPGHEECSESMPHRARDDLCFNSSGRRWRALARPGARVPALIKEGDHRGPRGHVAHRERGVEEDFGRSG